MDKYFLRLELCKGTPTDVSYGKPGQDLHPVDLITWNDFEFDSDDAEDAFQTASQRVSEVQQEEKSKSRKEKTVELQLREDLKNKGEDFLDSISAVVDNYYFSDEKRTRARVYPQRH